MQDTVEMLASYRPGGGDYLYDEEAFINRLKEVKERLSEGWKRSVSFFDSILLDIDSGGGSAHIIYGRG